MSAPAYKRPISMFWLSMIVMIGVWIVAMFMWDVHLPEDSILNHSLFPVGLFILIMQLSTTLGYHIWKNKSSVWVWPWGKTSIVPGVEPIRVKAPNNKHGKPIFYDIIYRPEGAWLGVGGGGLFGSQGGGKKGWRGVPDIPNMTVQVGNNFYSRLGEDFITYDSVTEKDNLGWIYTGLMKACAKADRAFDPEAPVMLALIPDFTVMESAKQLEVYVHAAQTQEYYAEKDAIKQTTIDDLRESLARERRRNSAFAELAPNRQPMQQQPPQHQQY